MERLSVNTPSAAMHPTDPTDDLLRTALDLAARRDRVRAVAGEQATSRALVRETLESLGLDPTLARVAAHANAPASLSRAGSLRRSSRSSPS
jgi:hypothetical protein